MHEFTREKTCCATGHRPNKLLGGYRLSSIQNRDLSKAIYKILEFLLIEDDIDTFISGGALGFDTIFFLTVEALKKEYKEVNIKNILAIPTPKQDVKWFKEDVDRYKFIKSLADDIIEVYETPGYVVPNDNIPVKMIMRNKFMVDMSSTIVAGWNGDPAGGTAHCVKYASSEGKRIIRVPDIEFFKIYKGEEEAFKCY